MGGREKGNDTGFNTKGLYYHKKSSADIQEKSSQYHKWIEKTQMRSYERKKKYFIQNRP